MESSMAAGNDEAPVRGVVRQGDVLLVPVTLDGDEGTVVTRGTVVLAEGEATGHAHVVRSRRATLRQLGRERILVITGKTPVLVEHEEHTPLRLSPGAWRVVRQREYRPDTNDGFGWVAD
jgi:hypothetical protein